MKGVAVGAGYFAQFHYDAWQRLGGLAALCDTDQEKAKKTAAQFGIASVYRTHLKSVPSTKPFQNETDETQFDLCHTGLEFRFTVFPQQTTLLHPSI